MGQRVFITSSNRPEDDEIKGAACAEWVSLGGAYFFLYPDILDLQKKTGQLIDCEQDAYFGGPSLDVFERFLLNSKKRALAQPESWQQRIGQELPSRKPIFQLTFRKPIIEMIDSLLCAVAKAREEHKGVMFLEE